MADEWDNIILHKKETPPGVKVNSVPSLYNDAVPSMRGAFSKVTQAKEVIKSTVKNAEKISKPEVKQAAVLPSPYVSKLPSIWSADLANKFAVAALALVVTFGVYSFGEYIAIFGLENTIAMTADSMSEAASAIAPFLNF